MAHSNHLKTRSRRRLFDYPEIKGQPIETNPSNIAPYLVDGPDLAVHSATKPISPDLPEVRYGNKPTGDFTITPEQYPEFMADPIARNYVRLYVGARELLHDQQRWCLWLLNAPVRDRTGSPLIKARVEAIQKFRKDSKAASTNVAARTAYRFRQITKTEHDFVCIPRHVSEARGYFPVKHLDKQVIASDATFIADDPTGLLWLL